MDATKTNYQNIFDSLDILISKDFGTILVLGRTHTKFVFKMYLSFVDYSSSPQGSKIIFSNYFQAYNFFFQYINLNASWTNQIKCGRLPGELSLPLNFSVCCSLCGGRTDASTFINNEKLSFYSSYKIGIEIPKLFAVFDRME